MRLNPFSNQVNSYGSPPFLLIFSRLQFSFRRPSSGFSTIMIQITSISQNAFYKQSITVSAYLFNQETLWRNIFKVFQKKPKICFGFAEFQIIRKGLSSYSKAARPIAMRVSEHLLHRGKYFTASSDNTISFSAWNRILANCIESISAMNTDFWN